MMAIDEPAADDLPAAGSIATGILAVARPTVDGRPAWPVTWIHAAVERFVPGTVPLIDGHNRPGAPAPVVGYLVDLEAVPEGLRYRAMVTAAAAGRLRARGGHAAVSVERRVSSSSRRGVIDRQGVTDGHTVTVNLSCPPTGPVIAVAILDNERPANPSSWIGVFE